VQGVKPCFCSFFRNFYAIIKKTDAGTWGPFNANPTVDLGSGDAAQPCQWRRRGDGEGRGEAVSDD
jgi:hypothetical protein